MAWTLEIAKERVTLWLNAEAAVASGQEYRMGTRSLVRADLADIRQQLQFWRNEVDKLSRGGGSKPAGARVMRVVPRDL